MNLFNNFKNNTITTTEIIQKFNPVEWDNEGNPLFSEAQLAEAIEYSSEPSIPVKEWISVEDRLPEVEEKWGTSDYLLCKDEDKNNIPFVAWYSKSDNGWTVAHHFASSGNVKVSHYQSLPKQ